MDVKQFYASIGGNYDEALGRLMKDRLIEKYVRKFPSDPSFAALKAAITENRLDDAFAASHTLKGVSMNFAFSQLSRSAVALTDALRPANRDALNDAMLLQLFSAVERDYTEVIDQINFYAID